MNADAYEILGIVIAVWLVGFGAIGILLDRNWGRETCLQRDISEWSQFLAVLPFLIIMLMLYLVWEGLSGLFSKVKNG